MHFLQTRRVTRHSLSSACQFFHWICPVLSSQRRDWPAGWLLAKVPSFRGFCSQSARNQSSCQSTYCTWGQYSVRPEQQATEEKRRTVLYLRPIALISEHFHKSFQCLSLPLETGCTQLVFTVHLWTHTFATRSWSEWVKELNTWTEDMALGLKHMLDSSKNPSPCPQHLYKCWAGVGITCNLSNPE